MQHETFPFHVERTGDKAFVAMYLGDGVTRARTMPVGLLKHLGRLCGAMKAQAQQALTEERQREVPAFPGFLLLAEASVDGACALKLGVHKDDRGSLVTTIGVYDEGDDAAPALVLSNEQIDTFVLQALGYKTMRTFRAGNEWATVSEPEELDPTLDRMDQYKVAFGQEAPRPLNKRDLKTLIGQVAAFCTTLQGKG